MHNSEIVTPAVKRVLRTERTTSMFVYWIAELIHEDGGVLICQLLSTKKRQLFYLPENSVTIASGPGAGRGRVKAESGEEIEKIGRSERGETIK